MYYNVCETISEIMGAQQDPRIQEIQIQASRFDYITSLCEMEKLK